MAIIAPSILSADFSRLSSEIAEIEKAEADWVHLDVMDGSFVPEITFGAKLVKDLRPLTKKTFDVHLMIREPQNHIETFSRAGADIITFHLEAAPHSQRIAAFIRSLGKKCGISIVPSTPVIMLENMLPFVDLVLVMTVNPGWGGQELIGECLGKVSQLKEIRRRRNLEFLISADGGINASTAAAAREVGADVLVTGSAFFKSQDKKAFTKLLAGDNLCYA